MGRASLEELLADYRDYLRVRDHALWEKDSKEAQYVRRLGRQIRHIQLEDIAASREHRHLAPGEGAIDFVALREALAVTGYDGYITVELYPYLEDPSEAAVTSLRRLRALGY